MERNGYARRWCSTFFFFLFAAGLTSGLANPEFLLFEKKKKELGRMCVRWPPTNRRGTLDQLSRGLLFLCVSFQKSNDRKSQSPHDGSVHLFLLLLVSYHFVFFLVLCSSRKIWENRETPFPQSTKHTKEGTSEQVNGLWNSSKLHTFN